MPSPLNEKITLYFLEDSKAHRVMWLLEELNLPYEFKHFKSDSKDRADPALFKVNPLGKSPVLTIGRKTLAESGYIVSHMTANYDFDGKFKFSDEEQERINYFTYYCEGTLMGHVDQLIIFDIARKQAPYMTKSICNTVCSAIEDGYAKSELVLNLNFLEKTLCEEFQKHGRFFFVGGKLSAADILFIYPIEWLVNGKGKVFSQSKWPNIYLWRQNMVSRVCLKKANSHYVNKYV